MSELMQEKTGRRTSLGAMAKGEEVGYNVSRCDHKNKVQRSEVTVQF